MSCLSNATVNNLVSLSIEKYKLPSTTNACLSYNGKKLDGMLSIRLANLINNAKLDLIIIELTGSVNLRINGVCMKTQLSKILRVSPNISAASLVSQFLQECGVAINWRIHTVKLSAMQNGIDNKSSDFETITVGSIVGNTSSASLRLVIEDAADTKKVEEAQLEQKRLREKLETEKAQVRLKSTDEYLLVSLSSGTENIAKNDLTEDPNATTIAKIPEVSPAIAEFNAERQIPKPESVDAVLQATQQLSDPQPVHLPPTDRIQTSSDEQTPSWVPSKELKDTLYQPRGHIELYENPNDDYNVTTRHAELYLKSLQAMQKPSKKHIHIQPTRYTIRIRFPDRRFLDLIFEDSSAPLGQLFKKLDSYVHPNFLNNYVLKNGCPPFNEIEMGFSQNNVKLKDHPNFQEERVLLVWEATANLVSRPYLKEDLQARDLSEMPTVSLESNRNKLHDEDSTPKTKTKTIPTTADGSVTKKRPGVPKWFKG